MKVKIEKDKSGDYRIKCPKMTDDCLITPGYCQSKGCQHWKGYISISGCVIGSWRWIASGNVCVCDNVDCAYKAEPECSLCGDKGGYNYDNFLYCGVLTENYKHCPKCGKERG